MSMLSGCYLSHRRVEDRDADVTCTPLSDVASFHAEILSASPDGCSVVGHEFDRIDVRLAEPLPRDCIGSVARSECAAALDYECWIPDSGVRYRGTVTRDPITMTVIGTSTWVTEPCVRTERWTWID
jgi:hypothetical protein